MADQNGSSDNDNKKETIISSISSENTSNIPPKPPMHTSGNSIIFSTASSNNKKSNSNDASNHNRNVTPHTESLMTLFAKPVPATPQTPTLDVINSFSGSLCDDDDNEQPMKRSVLPPALPDYFTRKVQENEIVTPIQNNNSIPNVRQINMDDRDIPFIPQTTTEEQKFERFHSECTQVTHNRDVTQVSPNLRRKNRPYEEGSSLYSNERTSLIDRQDDKSNNKLQRLLQSAQCDTEQIKPTLIGAFLFSLYQLVFCFALASAITRPSHASSDYSSELLAPMVLMACMGSLISGPLLITVLGADYPSLYPCLDMFLAPFYAQMAVDIDSVLAEINGDDDISVFLATFVSLNAFGMLLSGLLCILAGRVKLANLAGYLPYPVLCGFFSSVGISIWTSAFKVDTGVTIQKATMARNGIETFGRHIPSILGGTALWLLGPKGAHYLVGIIASTVCSAYLTMLVTGTSLENAQEASFFWNREEVIMSKDDLEYNYGPPSPFGLLNRSVFELICWPAFKNGIPGVIAMSVIYLLRCSIHAGALTKCSNKLKTNNSADTHLLSSPNKEDKTRQNGDSEHGYTSKKETKPKDLLLWYANGLFAIAFSGGFAVLPAIALGGIFAKMSAQSRSPQYGAMFILLFCYLSDFTIASYVPKCTFSSLLVFAALDLLNTWFIKSYQKSATEWLAVPFIVVISLTFGMLQSVALGLVCSTLIFVGSFQRAGVVKFIANGLTIRSTIERSCDDNDWLDQNADQIQVIVLQNYLFFGNANSCMRYIESMFDPCDGEVDLPPIPKYIILDLSIMTGIDTSAVDVLGDISALCKEHKCSLIFSAISSDIKRSLITGGVKPSRTNKHLNFSSDLESALGKAEDELLKYVGHNEEKVSIHFAFSVLLVHHLAL